MCKEWSLTSDIIPKANAWPWLMHSPNIADGVCKFFDPINEREYTLKIGALLAYEQLTFRFSKDGWVVVTEGNEMTFILNPFTQEVIDLPNIDRYFFDGISLLEYQHLRIATYLDFISISMAPSLKYFHGAMEKKSGVLKQFHKLKLHSMVLNTTLFYMMENSIVWTIEGDLRLLIQIC